MLIGDFASTLRSQYLHLHSLYSNYLTRIEQSATSSRFPCYENMRNLSSIAHILAIVYATTSEAVKFVDVAPWSDECGCWDIRTLEVFGGGRVEDCRQPCKHKKMTQLFCSNA